MATTYKLSALPTKATPVGADAFLILDSVALTDKTVTLANLFDSPQMTGAIAMSAAGTTLALGNGILYTVNTGIFDFDGGGSINNLIDLSTGTLEATGIATFGGAQTRTANAIGALAINVAKWVNTKTIAVDTIFTFSGTPATAQTWFALIVTNSDTVQHTLTVPSSFSLAQAGAITTVVIPASGKLLLTWQYDGSVYNLYGDPSTRYVTFAMDGAGSVLTAGSSSPIKVPAGGIITGYSMMCNPSGSVTFNVLRAANNAGLPTASIINGVGGGGGTGTLPAISSGVEGSSTTLTNWSNSGAPFLTAGDNLALAITSPSTATQCTFSLYYR